MSYTAKALASVLDDLEMVIAMHETTIERAQSAAEEVRTILKLIAPDGYQDPAKTSQEATIIRALPPGVWIVSDIANQIRSNDEMRSALGPFINDGELNRVAFGNWCRKNKERIVDGVCLTQAGVDSNKKVIQWQVMKP